MKKKTYGKLSFHEKGNKWILDKIEPHVSIKLKALFRHIPVYQTEGFEFPNRDESMADLSWFTIRYPVEMTDQDRLRLKSGDEAYVERLNNIEKILAPDYKPAPVKFEGISLREYQASFMEVVRHKRKTLLGDEVGIGKTFSYLATGALPDALPMAIVCQTHLPAQQEAMIKEMYGEKIRVHQITQTKIYPLPEADFYIFKYSQIAKWSDFFTTGYFKAVAFDEIQELRNQTSKKYGGAKAIATLANYVIGASATPIVNYGDETYSVMNIIEEGCLGSWSDFCREWVVGGRFVKNPQALGTYLREKGLFIRRTRQDVGRELPPVQKVVHYVETDERAWKNVEDVAAKLAVKALTGSFTERGQSRRDLDIMVRKATGVGKAFSVAQYAKVFLESGKKIVLVGWHRDVYKIWLKELAPWSPVLYTGTEDPKAKVESFRQFTEGKSQVFILSSRSGAGLNGLQKVCDTIIFGELDWSNKIHEQAIGRLQRDDLMGNVMAIFLVCDEGSDPPIIDILALKDSQSTAITDPFADVQEVHQDDSRLKMLAEYILKKANKPIPVGVENEPDSIQDTTTTEVDARESERCSEYSQQ